MFDYVIVGAGSAGCVVANRLSATGASVLLLEAGGSDKSFLVHMPVGFAMILAKGWMDWGYMTEPQEALEGRRLPWLRGKVLGGSSSVNGMVYIRGDPSDYDHWAQLGATGWSFADCLPYFTRAEDWANVPGDAYHGKSGPLGILRVPIDNPLARAWIEAGRQAGYRVNPDFCGDRLEGFGPADFTIAGNRRASASAAYLTPVRNRPNLTVVTNAEVSRVLIENERAVGVEYAVDGRTERAFAAEQVVLSGGAINSPALLLHSGIGPADELSALGIKVRHELPGVGRNLQDHLQSAVKWSTPRPVSLYRHMKPLAAMTNMARYALFRSGPNARMGLEAMAFLRSGEEVASPDLQFYCAMYLFDDVGALAKRHGFMAFYNPTRPLSRGYIGLRSADPRDKPIIQPRYLTEEADVLTMRKGFRIAREVVNQQAYDGLRGDELAPGPSVQTDAEIDAYNRRTGSTVYHPVGSCKMGTDAMAVVDPRLRVRGIDGLRVIDASIMPSLVSANTNAATIMIAEKGAAMIAGTEIASDRAVA